jgi:hypothetical protein
VVKIKRERVNSPNFAFYRMYVHWREREHEEIDFLVSEYPDVIIVLS